MKSLIKFTTITFIFLAISSLAKAQSNSQEKNFISRDAISTAGETVSVGDISITYIIGEVVGEFFSNPEASKYVTAGFVQPDIELKEILDRDISRNFTVFPNPVRNGIVKLAFNNVSDGKYTVDIIDVLGRTLKTQVIDFKRDDFLYSEIDISNLVKGVYFLKVASKEYKGQVKLIKL